VKKPQGRGGAKKSGSAAGDDDHALWQHAAATIEPLKRTKGRFHPASDAVKSGVQKPAAQMPSAAESAAAKHRSGRIHPEILPAKQARTTAPELAVFDRNSVRKIRGGRVEIEARVDLHGMRQDEAHAELRRFLFSCQSRGLRFVLVITGKGMTIGTSNREAGDSGRERGILKRNVPRWLDEPDLRTVVVSFTTAAIQHGGEGAVYVHLRSKNRARD
jgi:DNA-nicking Smr family endonuclease